MKWLVGALILCLSVVGAEARTVKSTCNLIPNGIYAAKYSTHMKGFKGMKCWHASVKVIKVSHVDGNKQLYKEFEQWKFDQWLACFGGVGECNPNVKKLFMP
jgi:hypothetical protein